MYDLSPKSKSEKSGKKLLRRPRLSKRVPPSATLRDGVNDEDLNSEFHFIDAPLADDVIDDEGNYDDDDDDDDSQYIDLYPNNHFAPLQVENSKCHKKWKSEIEKKLFLAPVQPGGLVKTRYPRGPRNFPCRRLHRMKNLLYDMLWDEDDLAYYEVPAFTLNDFIYQIAAFSHTPVHKVKQAVLSKHNYKKLTRMMAEQNSRTCDRVARVDFKEQLSSIPAVANRIPNRHLLVEMAALVKEQMHQALHTELKAVIRPLPKFTAPYYHGEGPQTEIVIYETGSSSPTKTVNFNDVRQSLADSLLQSTTPRYFQGASRSQSPFVAGDGIDLTVPEMSVLDCLANGGLVMSLKAMFLSVLPDLTPCLLTLTYLNISFNDFKFFPMEVLSLRHMTVLKMRNNPLRELPDNISLLYNLKTLVVSFCMISTIPTSLFSIGSLNHLDLSYNLLTFLPDEIQNGSCLSALNVEGNQLSALPCGALRLHHHQLTSLRVKNNFMHPLFWREATKNQPQRLEDMATLTLHNFDVMGMHERLDNKYPRLIDSFSMCDCCSGPRYGPGIRIIRPCSLVFGVRNLPFLFRSCSPNCAKAFMDNSENPLM